MAEAVTHIRNPNHNQYNEEQNIPQEKETTLWTK